MRQKHVNFDNKNIKCVEGEHKNVELFRCSKLSYQLKTACYKHKMLHVSFMVTPKTKTLDKQVIKKSMHIIMKKSSNHQEGEQEKKKGTKELQINQKTITKMATVCSHLSTITLNVNRLNLPKDRVVIWSVKHCFLNC